MSFYRRSHENHLKEKPTCSFSVAGDGIFKFPSSHQAVGFPALLMGLKEMM